MALTVLIAEDDRGVIKQLTRVVEEAGYQCISAPDGATALEEVRQAAPDLILLDLLLPKKDGRKVLATLQQEADTRDIPVVAMSGIFRGRNTARELRDAGAQGFLEKPFAPEDLIAHLHALIGPPEQEAQDEEVDESAAAPDTISLAEHTPAEVLWAAMGGGFSGAIQFQQEKRRKVVILEGGIPRQIRSNSAAECLGRRLFRAGRIDGEALEESLRLTREDGKRQGEALVGLGVVSQDEIDHELLAQAEDKLLEVFGWDEGRCWLEKDVHSISYATELDNWTPRLVILRGVNRMNAERARAQLAPFGPYRLAARDRDFHGEELLIPEVAEVLALIKSGAATADVIESHPGPLYGLWLTGIVLLVDPESGQIVTEIPSAEAAAEAAPELRAVLADLEAKNYFEMLGVDEDGDAKQVRSAFLKLAKSYHPDGFRKAPESTRAVVSEIFTLLSTANDTLSDGKERQIYLRRVGKGGGEDERKVVERILGAERKFSEGEALFNKRAYAKALELFEAAISLQGDESDYHAYYGWTHYLANAKSPGAAELAREHLDKALALAPESVTGYYFLGRLHKACGEDRLALETFRRVLDLDPDHVEASRELRLGEIRKGKDQKGSKGVFGFGKKGR